jgi:hypothetical protein
MSPLLQICTEHPEIPVLITVLWHIGVALALALIYIELRAHNNRAEKTDLRQQFQDERNRPK